MNIKYRKDIQILRGIALLYVVLFHINIPGFHSGFIGVDIFFVISGFLMALLYDPSKTKMFFKKRIARLLPAYYTTIIAVLIVSFFIITPNEYNQLDKQSIFASFFISNFYFWSQNSYFSNIDFNPLLHTWSLSVEIQFYFTIPLISLLFHKYNRILVSIAITSLILCLYLLYISPKTSFFIMPLRVWEFLAGYLSAKYYNKLNNLHYKWLGIIAFLAIIISPLIKIDGNAMNLILGHPGVLALFIVLSTTTILIVGLPDKITNSHVGRFMELLGKYSYSIYLVHFPIIVLFLYKPFSGTILKIHTIYDYIMIILLIIAASMLMYYFIENKFRNIKRNVFYILLSIPIIVLLTYINSNLLKNKYNNQELKVFTAIEDRGTYRCGKVFRLLHPFSKTCNLNANLNNPTKRIYLVGNSHADSIKETLIKIGNKKNISIYFTVSNNPLMKKGKIKIDDIIKESKNNKIDLIILHYSPFSIDTNTIDELTKIATLNNIKVAFIMPVPTWNKSIPYLLYNYYNKNTPLPIKTKKDYSIKYNIFYNKLSKIKNLHIYNTVNLFCKPVCKIINEQKKLYYFDDGHLTLTGAQLLKSVFFKIIYETLNH